MPREFIRDWSAAIRKQYPKYWMVGEVFERDSAHTAFFQGGKTGWDGIDTDLPSVFDFKLWETSQEVFTGKKPIRALRDVLKYDGLYANINNVTTLTNNHDTDRFMSLPGATLEGAMMHTAFVLSSRGIPQLYYGEELAMTGGHDPDNRKDFPGGFPGDTSNVFVQAGITPDQWKLFNWVRQWIRIRRDVPALRAGTTVDLFYDSDVYVFARRHAGSVRSVAGERLVDNSYSVIVALNRSNTSKRVPVTMSEFNNPELGCAVNLIGADDVVKDILMKGKKFERFQNTTAYCFTKPADTFEFTVPPRSFIAMRMF
jgi:neopullulanase